MAEMTAGPALPVTQEALEDVDRLFPGRPGRVAMSCREGKPVLIVACKRKEIVMVQQCLADPLAAARQSNIVNAQ